MYEEEEEEEEEEERLTVHLEAMGHIGLKKGEERVCVCERVVMCECARMRACMVS